MGRRRSDVVDRRSIRLEITQLGQSALDASEQTVSAVLLEWFSGIEARELEIVRRVLSDMLSATGG